MKKNSPFSETIPIFIALLVVLVCIVLPVAGDKETAGPTETTPLAETAMNPTTPIETETLADTALILSLAADTSDGPVPLTVRFTGAASGLSVDFWNWTVDGVAADADGPNVTCTFTETGTHTVSLTVTNESSSVTNTTSVEVAAEENGTAAPALMSSPLAASTPITHPHIWNVSCIGTGNYTNISAIPEIGDGDTIRIWGVEGHVYEGGITINAPDVRVERWDGSPAHPLITNTSGTASAFTVTADNATFRGLNISGNRLENQSGAGINATGTETDHVQRLTVADCTFAGNEVNGAQMAGGALCAWYIDDLLVEGTVFTGNTASPYGGGSGGGAGFRYCNGSTLTDTTFTDNAAGYGGGAQFLLCNGPTLTDTTFTDNTVTRGGGGVDFLYSYGPITLAGTTVTNNTGAYQGGGARFYIADGSCITLTDTTFTDNSATFGGGTYFTGDSDVTFPGTVLARTTFTNNSATLYGGGAYFVNCAHTILTDLFFNGNTADCGGGAYFCRGDITVLNTSAFTGNRATHAGGAINVTGFFRPYYKISLQNFTIADCTFTGNAASGTDASGGALSARAVDNLSVERTVFTGNTASTGGGADLSWCNDTFIADCHFENPTNIHAENSTGVLNATRTPGTNIAGGPYLGGNLWLTDPVENISEWGTDADLDGICDQNLTITGLGTDSLPLVYGGTVTGNSTPRGASVLLDGVAINRTTDAALYLPVGDHMITVTLDGYVTQANQTVTVVPGEMVSVSFALEAVPTPTPRSSSGSGGESSDIAAGSAGNIQAGGNASVLLPGSAIYEIMMTAADDIPELLVTIEESGLLSGVTAPAETVYEYDEVTLYHTTDDAVEDARVLFKVQKSWLEEKGLDPADVVLYRYHDGEWQALSTVVVDEDATSWHFSAQSPGFSFFAIGGDRAPVAVETTAAGAQAGTTEPVQSVTTGETTSPMGAESSRTEAAEPFSLTLLICGAAVLIVAAVALRKRN